MSTKTLRKRIALVAVAALGAGVLSVTPANAADGEALVSLIASNTGSAVTSATEANARQVGFVALTNSTTAITSTSLLTFSTGQAQTAVCLATCSLAWEIDRESDTNGVSVVVVGGTLGSVADTITATNGSGVLTVAGDRSKAVLQAGTTNSSLLGVASASSGATSMQLQFYKGAGITGQTTATNGSLVGSLTLTIAPASSSGVYNAANSTIAVQIPYVKGTTASGLLAYDNTSRIANGSVGAIYVNLQDAFTAAITTGILTATATNGALVNINDGAPAAGHDFAAVSGFDSETDLVGGDAYISVTQPVAGVAGTSTVTITLDGQVIATKTLNWNGDAASISVDTANSASSFKNGYATYAAYTGATAEDFLNMNIYYVVKDAAGNVLDLPSSAPTVSGATGSMVGASLSAGGDVTGTAALGYGDQEKQFQTASNGYGVATMLIPASTLQGAGTYKLKFVNGSGTALYSPVINATVSNGGLNSFTASWDKASYSPGEIAVLTVTGKDVYGNVIADGTGAAGLSVSVSGSATVGFNGLGTACTAANQSFAGGKFTCKFAANTEGAWSYTVDMTTATPQAATVGSLKITTGGAVTNADVLKAIVSLIASINKQIAALQKALLKK